MRRFPLVVSRVLCCLVCGGAGIDAAPIDLWLANANRFYEEKQYDSAICYYERIVESGIENGAVYYNIGNAWFRQNRLGLAILSYEKARRLEPDDPDIVNNLNFARRMIVDRVPEPERTFLDAALWRMHTLFPLNTQIWILFVLVLLLSLLIAAALFSARNTRLWIIYLSSLLVLLSLCMAVSVGFKIYHEENVVYAVVVTRSVDARNEPKGAKILFTAHEGTTFRIRKSMDDWSLVSLPNGIGGWVENSALGRI